MNWQTASTQSYYRIEDNGCNICDHSAPLLVNCSGVIAFDTPFKNHTAQGRHDFYLMYLLHGRLNIRCDGVPHVLNAGDMVFYTPERPYAYQSTTIGRMVYLWIHFTGSEAADTLKRRGLQTARVYHPGCVEEMEDDFEEIQRLFITRPLFYLEESAARLDMLLTHIGRSVRAPLENPLNDRLKTSLNFLNRHYAEPVALETLAGMEYLSVSRYSALFRQLTGVSPQRYLIDLRLKNARDMLMNTDLSVSEVARSVGYDDPLYFSRLFRKHCGTSPRMARQSAMKAGD